MVLVYELIKSDKNIASSRSYGSRINELLDRSEVEFHRLTFNLSRT